MTDPVCDVNLDELYEEAAATYGAALDRLARAYEADPDKRRDLLQEIHLALCCIFESDTDSDANPKMPIHNFINLQGLSEELVMTAHRHNRRVKICAACHSSLVTNFLRRNYGF